MVRNTYGLPEFQQVLAEEQHSEDGGDGGGGEGLDDETDVASEGDGACASPDEEAGQEGHQGEGGSGAPIDAGLRVIKAGGEERVGFPGHFDE